MGSALSSAITQISLGPANTSMPDAAVEDALGFGDVLVARPGDHVSRLAGDEAEGQCGDRLHATERQDHVGTGNGIACSTTGWMPWRWKDGEQATM